MAKYRFGFVSNSSSSSFVVSFPKNMKITSKNIKKYLFSDLDDNQEMQGWDVTVRDIAEALAKRMTEQKERALNNLPSSEQCGDETDGELVINTLANRLTGAPEFDWDTWSDVFDDKLERYSIEQKYASEQVHTEDTLMEKLDINEHELEALLIQLEELGYLIENNSYFEATIF